MKPILILLLLSVPLPAVGKALAPQIPDFTRGDFFPEKSKHDWNLGPLGLRGRMLSSKSHTQPQP
jgi:hypothetical protein